MCWQLMLCCICMHLSVICISFFSALKNVLVMHQNLQGDKCISADQNGVNGCCSRFFLRPRGAFTGTFPKESYLQPSQWSWRSHTQWTYGQSPIVCCAIYGSVACHLFCLSETSMTPVWILNKRLFLCLGEDCCHLIFLSASLVIDIVLFSWDWQWCFCCCWVKWLSSQLSNVKESTNCWGIHVHLDMN